MRSRATATGRSSTRDARTRSGTRPFPVESIRLKTVRDALEDAELVALARAAGEGRLADRLLARLVPSARGWERRPEPWLRARLELGDALARRAPRVAR